MRTKTRLNRQIIWTLALALLISVPLSAMVVNRVVVRVNDRIATLQDYRSGLSERVFNIRQSEMPADDKERLLDEAPKQVLEEMVQQLLLLSRADQLRFTVTNQELESAMTETRKRMGVEEEEAFQMALAQSGMTETDLRLRLEENLLVQRVIGSEVQGKIEVDEEGVKRYYREHPEEFGTPRRLRLQEVIVLSSADDATNAGLQATADELLSRVNAGEDFEAVAAEMADQDRTTEVIDLDWVDEGDLDPDLEAAVWDLEPDVLSAPVGGRGGLHIVQVVEVEKASVRPYEEVEPLLFERERRKLFADAFEDYVRDIRERAYIRVDPPPEAAGFRLEDKVEPPSFTLDGPLEPEPEDEPAEEVSEETDPEG